MLCIYVINSFFNISKLLQVYELSVQKLHEFI